MSSFLAPELSLTFLNRIPKIFRILYAKYSDYFGNTIVVKYSNIYYQLTHYKCFTEIWLFVVESKEGRTQKFWNIETRKIDKTSTPQRTVWNIEIVIEKFGTEIFDNKPATKQTIF